MCTVAMWFQEQNMRVWGKDWLKRKSGELAYSAFHVFIAVKERVAGRWH